jgi:NAD(P) transhydrogenase
LSAVLEHDLIVIGSGPAGQKAAIGAAKQGKSVAVVDRREMIGGVCVHTGTIPSKTLRAAILHLTGYTQRTPYGQESANRYDVTISDLAFRVHEVLDREMAVVRDQLRRNRVATFFGTARFRDAHTVDVDTVDGVSSLRGSFILIACGTRPAHAASIPFDGTRVIDSDQIISLGELPRELTVVGGGIIGLEYASMLSALGVEVTIVDQRTQVLEFADREIVEALEYQMRRQGAIFRLAERVTSIGIDDRERVVAGLESGKSVRSRALLYTVGRQANTDLLNLPAIGLSTDARGRLQVNERYQTSVPHVFAAGDVIGFPALASTSMEQGRLASLHMFGGEVRSTAPELIPYGIYTIPEISMVGRTEEELTAAKVPYEVGVAKYAELAKAQMIGDDSGLLKILFDPGTLRVLGVHIIGDSATELIHIGQAVMSLGGTLEYFRDIVFNYPNLAEGYKVAALDGLNKL